MTLLHAFQQAKPERAVHVSLQKLVHSAHRLVAITMSNWLRVIQHHVLNNIIKQSANCLWNVSSWCILSFRISKELILDGWIYTVNVDGVVISARNVGRMVVFIKNNVKSWMRILHRICFLR